MRKHHIPYSNFIGAIQHCFLSALGEFSVEEYLDHSMGFMIIPLFFLMSFILFVYNFNILIAIMSDTFMKNNNKSEAKKKISQLEFVYDNWWIKPIKYEDKINFIVAA